MTRPPYSALTCPVCRAGVLRDRLAALATGEDLGFGVVAPDALAAFAKAFLNELADLHGALVCPKHRARK
jgi:Trm112p-like protein